MKKWLKLLLIFAITLIPKTVLAYTINNCETNIEIKEDTIVYRDTIKATFDESNTIIEKEVPKKIKNINISTSYNIEDDVIKIDSLNYDTHKYSIKYEVKNNSNKEYKITLSNNYNAYINNLDYTIELPMNIESDDITLYLNDKKIKTNNIEIEDNKIYGNYESLKEDDILVLEIKDKDSFTNKYLIKTSIIGPIIFVIISYLIWLAFGKDRSIKAEKTSIPLRKENPLELALLYNGKATNKDIVYMILNLANRGYIKIIEKDKTFIFVRTKQYAGTNYKESVLFKSIFRKNLSGGITEYINIVTNKSDNKKIEYLDEITLDQLKYRLKRINNEVLSLTNSTEEKNKYFEKEAESKKVVLSLMLAFILVMVTSIPFIEMNKISLIPMSVIFSIVTLTELIKLSEKIDLTKIKYERVLLYILLLIIVWCSFVLILKLNYVYILSYIIGIISSLAILILYKYMPKRTIYATREMGKAEGLKKFINTCKDEELSRVLETNNNYYYEVLPYAFILGCNNKLTTKIKRFEINKPEWYELNSEFTIQKFNNSIGRLITAIINEDK